MSPVGRETAVARMQRILAEVLWIAERDGPLASEAAAHFGVTEDELRRDLEMASMIGGDGDDYLDMPVDMWAEGDRVFVFLRAFDRPLRLTPAEALSLVTAGSALVGVDPGDGALGRALEKVAGALGIEVGEQVDVDLGVGDATVFATLQGAVDDHHAVAIAHLNAEHGTRTERVVEPWGLFRERGAWYLWGHCRRAGAERQFRVDRIVAATARDEAVEVPDDLDPPTALRTDRDAPRLVLDLAPGARWVVESYPTEDLEVRPDGTLRATLAVVSRGWAERLLLRLGDAARVVEADPALGGADPGVEAAGRILARYGTDGSRG